MDYPFKLDSFIRILLPFIHKGAAILHL